MPANREIKPECKSRPIRSYVIRGGRITESQKRAFDRGWNRYGLSLFDGRVDAAAVFGRQAPLVLEVGFGMGDSLLAMAQAEPDKDFIGVEAHSPGVGRLINNAEKLNLKNLRVFMADAIDVLEDCISNHSLRRLQLYFPDPWHKKKHGKRRIVQPEFIQTTGDKLAVGGICHLATDWQPYAEHMLDVLQKSTYFENTTSGYDLTDASVARPRSRPLTRFERRGHRKGHGVWDFLFQRNQI